MRYVGLAMPRTLVGPVALILLTLGCHTSSGTELPSPDGAQMRAHVAELASNDYAGRFTFDDGGARTVEYLAQVYRRWDIAPLAEDYRLPFLITGTRERRCDSLSFEVAG